MLYIPRHNINSAQDRTCFYAHSFAHCLSLLHGLESLDIEIICPEDNIINQKRSNNS